MHPRTQLIRIQRGMLRRLRKSARVFLGSLSPSLKKYYLEYLREFHDFKEVSTKRDLLLAIQDAHIVLCGDYHTLSQAQRTVIRLLRDAYPILERQGRPLHLMLEMLRTKDKPEIDRFSKGEVSETEFLKSISFQRNWGFSWENYRQLFLFAHDKAIGIHGINLGKKKVAPTLRQRDTYAAKVLADLTEREEGALLFVLVGDLHLAANHLPRELHRQLRKKKLERRVLIIHQNNERFYWKLVERGLEQLIDVVKVKENVFCVMNTPPWVKLQSHVKWAELTAEEEKAPVLPKSSQRTAVGESFDTVDHTDEVRELVEVIAKFVGLEEVKSDDFQIHGPGDLSFLERLKEKGTPQAELKWLARCLTEFQGHFLPRENIIFLSSLSLNHAAAEAAIFLHAKASGASFTFRDPHHDFYPALWIEALGFLGSKVINHKRKCSGPTDLDELVHGKKGSKENLEAAKLALLHLREEKRYLLSRDRAFAELSFSSKLTPETMMVYYKVAKLLGQLLGEAMYQASLANELSRDELKTLFTNSFSSAKEAQRLYMEMIERVDRSGYRNVTKAERL